jgi:organic radical activating enzyme
MTAQAVYPVVDHFHTIQGEGAFAGSAAYFIRLAGCDVGCPWCDTKESWALDGHPELTVADLAASAAASGSEIVVITGGEPTMHRLDPIVDALHEKGLQVHLETSGAYPITGSFDWVTLSPKKYKPPEHSNYTLADEIKVIVAHRSDLDWGEQHLTRCRDDVRASLQVEWGSPRLLPLIVDYVKANPRWVISLQTHKYLDLP